MTDVTNSLNFYEGRSADVGDMLLILLHGQTVRECNAAVFDCKENKISVFPL